MAKAKNTNLNKAGIAKEDEFYNYLTKNNSSDFINKAKYIQSTTLKNTSIEMGFDQEYSSKEFLHYKILCKSRKSLYLPIKNKNNIKE